MPTPNGSTPYSDVPLSGNSEIDSLIYGTKWAGSVGTGAVLSYSFLSGSSYYSSSEYDGFSLSDGFVLTAKQKAAVASALADWSAVANIKFTVTTDSARNTGDLRFGGYEYMDSSIAAWAYYPGEDPACGDVWIGRATSEPAPAKGSYDYLTFLHEIGHALGLKHTFETEFGNPNVLPAQMDDVRYSVMSYTDPYWFEPTTPMLLDIAAIQYLYGANTTWHTGNDTYRWAPTAKIFETIWDAGGNDTIDASNQSRFVKIDLHDGSFSNIGQLIDNGRSYVNNCLAIAYGAVIENAIGSIYNDTLIGNASANLLNGLGGTDTLIGEGGDDTYVIDRISDHITELSGEGYDTVQIAIANEASYTLTANVEAGKIVSNAAINLTGNQLDNHLTGNAAVNVLRGGDGNDTLDGGAGADSLIGGLGDDHYLVDNAADQITELAGQGLDRVSVTSTRGFTYSLAAHLEEARITSNAAINLTGNDLDNRLEGNAAANILDGGLGADLLIGGLGNDTYVLDNLADQVIETSTLAKEIDSVKVSFDWTLGDNLENLTLLGSALNGTGNALNNSLTGNALDNRLDGGLGADRLAGGQGNDTYVVDNSGDLISEAANSGIDTVEAAVSWKLGNNLENLILTGTDHLNGTGNSLANQLTGNAGNNLLDGSTGIDSYVGSDGDDTYVLDNASELTQFASFLDSGSDSLQIRYGNTSKSALHIDLNSLQGIENISALGSGLFNLTGNQLDNRLIGNASANVLHGGDGNDTLEGGAGIDTLSGGEGDDRLIGGSGADRLAGGEGSDLFVFSALTDSALGSGARDVISDFVSGIDKIDLSALDAILSTRTLNDAFVFIGEQAFSAAGQLRFSTDGVDGMLYGSVDSDSAAEFEIQLLGVTSLNSGDFLV